MDFCQPLVNREKAALLEPKGGPLHKLQPGNWGVIKDLRRKTPTALDWSIPGAPDDPDSGERSTWVHASHCSCCMGPGRMHAIPTVLPRDTLLDGRVVDFGHAPVTEKCKHQLVDRAPGHLYALVDVLLPLEHPTPPLRDVRVDHRCPGEHLDD